MPRMPIRQHNDAVYDFWELQKEFNYSLNHYYGLNDVLNNYIRCLQPFYYVYIILFVWNYSINDYLFLRFINFIKNNVFF